MSLVLGPKGKWPMCNLAGPVTNHLNRTSPRAPISPPESLPFPIKFKIQFSISINTYYESIINDFIQEAKAWKL